MSDHLYLSPHLDDAIFSCGGLIAHQTSAGEDVLVLTVCAGDPPPGPLTPFAQVLHMTWGGSQEPVATRRAEDIAACGLLGASFEHLAIPDAVYRRVAEEPAYPDLVSIFGPVDLREADLATQLGETFSRWVDTPAAIYCPLGVGGHVDHRLVRMAAEQLETPLWYYYELPYVSQGGSLPEGLHLPDGREQVFQLTEQDVTRWIQAAAAYQSQISSFWEDDAHLDRELRQYVRSQGGMRVLKLA